ncbi:MAG: cupin domain-containing protein [Gaiellaceae bacterium]
MVPEAPLERTETGARPAGEGWFVLNVRDAQWFETDGAGFYASFEGENARFPELGIGVGILRPGEPSAMYHGEDAQEDFLVLSGECLLLIEGEERPLKAWDFVHCPPWTEHIFVGAGAGPCLVLGVGARRKGSGIRYPVSELALKYGAGVETETSDPKEAYARFGDDKPVVCPPEFPG